MARSNKSLGFTELRVGLFTFAALGVLLFLILNATGNFNPFERKLALRARFASADGLRSGTAVQLAGVPVGTVKEVHFLPADAGGASRIEARLEVSQRVDGQPITERIRTDSGAQLVASNLLGNEKVVSISLGTGAGAPVQENHILESSTPADFNQLAASGTNLVQQLNKLSVPVTEIAEKINNNEGTAGRLVNDPELYNGLNRTIAETETAITEFQTVARRINRGEGTAGRLLNDPDLYNSLNRTVGGLEAIQNDLRQGRGTAGKLLRDEALYNELRGTITEARGSITEVRGSINRLNGIADRFETIVIDLNEGRGTAGKLLKDEALYNDARTAIARLSSTSERIENLVATVERGEGTVGKLFRDEQLYNNVNQLSTEANKLIYDFRQNPRKFLTIKFELF